MKREQVALYGQRGWKEGKTKQAPSGFLTDRHQCRRHLLYSRHSVYLFEKKKKKKPWNISS
jgi:hypothetical protein